MGYFFVYRKLLQWDGEGLDLSVMSTLDRFWSKKSRRHVCVLVIAISKLLTRFVVVIVVVVVLWWWFGVRTIKLELLSPANQPGQDDQCS